MSQQTSSYWSYPIIQHDFWLGVGYYAYNTFNVHISFSACLEVVVWWFEERACHKGPLRVMPRCAMMSLALNEPKWVALYSNSNTTSKYAPQVGRND